MLCYFHEDQHGEVIAEKLGTQVGENESYLHTHFPATDTPQRTRSLFLLNRMRIIEDAYEQQSPLACSGACELTPQAVPLTKSTLRGIHQCHLDYLRTWGVRGTLVLSLPVNGKLWGIVRDQAEPVRDHDSERLLANICPDQFIDNNSTVEDLWCVVSELAQGMSA
jgi:light-regulated signal transduction histidine kinase (bacteriophytochrome)